MVNANAFQRQKERQEKIIDLAQRYTYAALYLLAKDLRFDHESLLRVIGGLQGISPELGRKIDNLWLEYFGTSYYPAPKSVLDMEIELETIEKGSAFFYRDPLYGKKDPYKDMVLWDILPDFTSEQEYDNALTRVRNKIIPVIDDFYKTLYVQLTLNISISTLYGPERRANRTFELHIIEREERDADKPLYKVQYGLSYSNGSLQVLEGDIPEETVYKIIYILKSEGNWE
jgi:hypothetical protein